MLWAYSMFCPFEYLLHSLLLSSSPEVWAFELDRLVFSPGLVTVCESGQVTQLFRVPFLYLEVPASRDCPWGLKENEGNRPFEHLT